jgi:hypothetical protein
MTLALTGPWAWAELGDPPPGEPPGPPTPPPPPDPPPPPLPPEPQPQFGFTWAGGGVRAVWDADLKLQAPGLTAWDGWENTTCGPTSAGVETAWPLPYDPGPDSVPPPPTTGAHAQLDWSRNAAGRSLWRMADANLNLYLHQYNPVPGVFWHVDHACDWLSWSALNDEIQREYDALVIEDPSAEPIYTGLVLPHGGPSQRHYNDLVSRGAPWCTYRDAAVRVRQEAADHPDIVRVAVVDELYRMLVGPDTMFDGLDNPFDVSHVEALRALLGEADAAAATSARQQCEAVIAGGGALSPLYTEAVYADPDYLGSPVLGADGYQAEAPVELWARMHAVTIPRFIVPSLILGTPKRPEVEGEPPVSTATDVTVLSAGASVSAAYTLPGGFVPWLSGPAPDWEVRVQYLVHANVPLGANHLRLGLFINGVPQPGASIAAAAPPASGTSTMPWFTTAWLDNENVYMVDVPVTPSWEPLTTGINTVELRVTSIDTNTTDLYDHHFYVFGALVSYIDRNGAQSTVKVELDPDDALFASSMTGGGACLATQTCMTSTPYLVGDQLDGVTIAAEIAAPWRRSAAEGWAGVPMARAWEELLSVTRAQLQGELGLADGRPGRVLSDERAWVADYDSLEYFDFPAAASRIRAGLDHAHGVSLVHLVLEVADVAEHEGRFAGYPSTAAPDYPLMNYLPRLTRSHLGEQQVWSFQVPADPSCEGTWTLAYTTDGTRDDSSYGPVAQVGDGTEGGWLYAFGIDPDDLLQDLPGISRSGVAYLGGTGTVSEDLGSGEWVRFGWGIKRRVASGGAEIGSPIGPTWLGWRVDPPAGCAAPALSADDLTASFTDERVPDYFERLSCALTTPDPHTCWFTAGATLGGDWADLLGGAP